MDDSRPMPLPAPVIRATFPASRCGISDSLEIAPPFPIGHGACVGGMFGRIEMRIVIDDRGAESGTCEGTRAEALGRFLERGGEAGQMPGAVDVADETFRRLGATRDTIESGGERRREREIRVAVGARKAALDAQALIDSHHTKTGSAVVV